MILFNVECITKNWLKLKIVNKIQIVFKTSISLNISKLMLVSTLHADTHEFVLFLFCKKCLM